MAVNAVFKADFAAFFDAVTKAEVKLVDLSSGAERVGTTLNKMVDNFSGRKLVQDAALMARAVEHLGGTSKLTAAELQFVGSKANEAAAKLAAMGKTVPPELQKLAAAARPIPGIFQQITGAVGPLAAALGVGFSVGAVVQLGRSILADADALVKLSDKTGITIGGLQRFRSVADDSGNTLDQLTTAVSQMQNRLAGGDQSAVAALDKLGLTLQSLRSLGPEQQFQAIARAIQDIRDPAEKVQIAMDLFGRSGAEILPSIKKGFDDVAASAGAMSDEAVRALDEVGDALTRLARTGKSFIGEVLNAAITTVEHSLVATVLFGNRHPSDYKRELEELQFLAQNFINDTVNNPALKPGQAASIGMPGIPDAAAMKSLADATAKHQRDIEQAMAKQARANAAATDASRRAETAYRSFNNEMGLLARQADRLRLNLDLLGREFELLTPAGSGGWIKGMAPELFSGEMEQSLIGLADGTRTVLEQTITWRDTLSDVVNVLGVVGDKWSTVAQGILRQTQAIVSLWGGQRDAFGNVIPGSRNRTAAVGQAIGVAGQLIPTGTTAGSVASGAAQGAAAGAPFAAFTAGASIAIGAGIGALVGWYQSGKAARQVNDVRDGFVASAGGLAMLDAKAHGAGVTLKAMLDADTVEEYEQAIRDLTAAIEFQDRAMEFVQETMDKYGLSVEDMGTAWSQQTLDKQAASLLKEFRALEAAGADVGLISEHMSEALNEYVRSAQKAGTTIPLEMREILNQLLQQGLLVDENGEAFESLEDAGLTFAESMTEVTKTLTEAIKELTDAIKRGLGDAITSLPPLDLGVPGVNEMAAGGSGRVTRPTLFLAGEAGAEDFAFSGAGKRFGGGRGGGGGGGGGTAIVELNGRVLAEVMVPELPGAIARYGLRN